MGKDTILGENIIVIYSSSDAKGKRDATGAFIPEAKAFAKHHCVPKENMLGVPCTKLKASDRREKVFSFLEAKDSGSVELIAWFGHGWSSGIQFGINKKNVDELLSALDDSGRPNLKHVLYACSTASTNENTRKVSSPGTDGGFADTLRDHMWDSGYNGGWVDAHLQPGHTTRNPYIMRFICNEEYHSRGGGNWLVKPKSTYWATWRNAIQNTTFRYNFPVLDFLTLDELPIK